MLEYVTNIFTNRNSDPGNWMARGVQSALFFYISCAPCKEERRMKRRRREAKEAQKAYEKEYVDKEPNMKRRPMAFETDPDWLHEIVLGPGPPPQFEAPTLLRKWQKYELDTPAETPYGDGPKEGPLLRSGHLKPGQAQPGHEHRLSNAIDNMKDSLKDAFHPDKWPWKPYHRPDEVLWFRSLGDRMNSVGDKMSKMWDKVKSPSQQPELLLGRKRAHTNESDRDWSRGQNPHLSDLHPPIVCSLPATKEDAAWMIMPPPSAAVMSGHVSPTAQNQHRIPMCIAGRPPRPKTPPKPTPKLVEKDEPSIGPKYIEVPAMKIRPSPRAAFSEIHVSKDRSARPASWSFHYIIPSQ
jgi:hypothetical protein